MDAQVTAAIAGAVSGGVVGAVGTITSQWFSGRERERMNVRLADERARVRAADLEERNQAKREEFLFRALEHFGGGTQERSVGSQSPRPTGRAPRSSSMCSCLSSSTSWSYLLAVQGSERSADAAHERQNVRRIVELLARIGEAERFRDSYEFSLHAIARKRAGRGIDLSSDPEIKSGVDQFLGDVATKLGVETSRSTG